MGLQYHHPTVQSSSHRIFSKLFRSELIHSPRRHPSIIHISFGRNPTVLRRKTQLLLQPILRHSYPTIQDINIRLFKKLGILLVTQQLLHDSYLRRIQFLVPKNLLHKPVIQVSLFMGVLLKRNIIQPLLTKRYLPQLTALRLIKIKLFFFGLQRQHHLFVKFIYNLRQTNNAVHFTTIQLDIRQSRAWISKGPHTIPFLMINRHFY